jgi:hypothetical protein
MLYDKNVYFDLWLLFSSPSFLLKNSERKDNTALSPLMDQLKQMLSHFHNEMQTTDILVRLYDILLRLEGNSLSMCKLYKNKIVSVILNIEILLKSSFLIRIICM